MNQPEPPGSGLDNIICLETWPLGGIRAIFWNLLSTGSGGPYFWELCFSQRILEYSQHSNALSGLGDKAQVPRPKAACHLLHGHQEAAELLIP